MAAIGGMLMQGARDASANAAIIFALSLLPRLVSVPAVPSVTVTRTAQTLSATETYAGSMQTAFGKLFHVSTIPISGTSTTSVTMGSYIDFYLPLDGSASMGLPTARSYDVAPRNVALVKYQVIAGDNGIAAECPLFP